METVKAYCEKPIVLNMWDSHIVETLKSLGFHTLFFNGNGNLPLMVHHAYIFTTDRIPTDAINCGNDVYSFFKEITK